MDTNSKDPEGQNEKRSAPPEPAGETNGKPDSDRLPLTSGEGIIFPLHEETESEPFGEVKKTHRMFKMLGWMVLLGIIYLLGFATRPDMMDRTIMNIKKWSSFALQEVKPVKEKVSLTVTGLIDKNFPGPSGPVPQASLLPEGSGIAGERKIKYWRDPMDATDISDRPGKSRMGMDRVPVYENGMGDTGAIKINPTMAQNIGVKTRKIKKMELRREIRTVGRLTYDERKVHHIHTKYEGWIEKLQVDFTGQEVNEGDLLFEIYSPELVSTQEELLLAMKYNQSLKDSSFPEIRRGAQNLLESTRRRLELFDVPGHQIESLMRDRKITKTMHIHSPHQGFVIEKKAQHGMYVKPGMSLYTIADLSNIWVLADIYEYEVPWIQIGQDAEMNLTSFPGKTFSGKVTYIDPFLQSETRTLKVRMELDNPGWNLKPDMYANITLKSVIARDAVAVPEEAVLFSGEHTRVIVKNSAGEFERREVRLGAQAKNNYQVLDGLKEGETVVISSGFLIDSESSLREALGKFQSQNRPPEMKSMRNESPGEGQAEGSKMETPPAPQEKKATRPPGNILLKTDHEKMGH